MDVDSKMTQVDSSESDIDNRQTTTMDSSKRKPAASNNLAPPNRKELSSFALFLSVVIFLNLCPFEQPASSNTLDRSGIATKQGHQYYEYVARQRDLGYLDATFSFVKLMFKNPIDLSVSERTRPMRFMQADAKIIAKMAKMWYIKKKIKKFNKKLKKHTIAVPVITAIPIYEHSY